MSNVPVELLLKAKAHIETYGWARYSFCPATNTDSAQTSPMCVLGAVNWAATLNPRTLYNRDARACWAELAQTITKQGWLGSLSGWNDAEGRTVYEVTRLFDQTINRLTNAEG